MLGVPLLQHKLRPPHTYLALVQRRALVDRLLHAETPLVVLSAPAGCGKTSTLVQWTQAERRPVAWVSLEAADADPAVFLSYLATAIAAVAEVPPAVFALLRQSDIAQAGPRLRAPRVGRRRLRPRSCWCSTTATTCAAGSAGTRSRRWRSSCRPEGRSLCPGAATRRCRWPGCGPPGAWRRCAWKGSPWTRTRPPSCCSLHGAPTDAETLAAVMDITEGWAAGVYLAAVLAEPLPPEDWLPHLRGDQREIARYLTAEVLARLPQRTRSFLEQTSILERLSAELCRAVTGRDDAGDELERAADQSLFVTALDDRGEWYRYHHLFAELLRAELVRHEPGARARPAPGRRGVVPGAPRARGRGRPLAGRRGRRLRHGGRRGRRGSAGSSAAGARARRGCSASSARSRSWPTRR